MLEQTFPGGRPTASDKHIESDVLFIRVKPASNHLHAEIGHLINPRQEHLTANGELYERVRIRSCKYLNNIVEQDHRRIKRRVSVMLGFKCFENARIVLAGVELAQKIPKQQFDLRRSGGGGASVPEMWARVLAA